jgi:hypothetical protein
MMSPAQLVSDHAAQYRAHDLPGRAVAVIVVVARRRLDVDRLVLVYDHGFPIDDHRLAIDHDRRALDMSGHRADVDTAMRGRVGKTAMAMVIRQGAGAGNGKPQDKWGNELEIHDDSFPMEDT